MNQSLDLNRIGVMFWWVKIITREPFCVYYFGPFQKQSVAAAAQYGYIEDLVAERPQAIEVEIKKCMPKLLTI